ncbi:hypothetical protein KKH27_04825 [bacterium]|nr:hypothetical protein [bacterium]MBU1983543.1 hypothetical protein [bacterium]
MKHLCWIILFSLSIFLYSGTARSAERPATIGDVPTPPDYQRVPVFAGSFAASLRKLDLSEQKDLVAGDGVTLLCDEDKVAITKVLPFNNQKDVGVDGVVRLWGEHLWNSDARNRISFPLDNGQVAAWKDWRDGLRPRKHGGRYIFTQITTPSGGYDSYQQFLSFVAEEMGAIALRRESKIVFEDSVTVGDLIVALRKDAESRVGIILDACKGPRGERLFLVGTSGTPSTTLYVMRPYSPVAGLGEWFTLEGAQWAIGQGSRTDMRRVTLR